MYEKRRGIKSLIMNLNTQSFLSVLRKHNGIAIWEDRKGNVTYEELVRAVEYNMNTFRQLGYTPPVNNEGQQVVLVDVSLGWRLVPIILAAMKMCVTVVPINRFHSPNQAKEIISCFSTEIVFDSTNVKASGIVMGERIDRSKRSLYEELNSVAFLLYTSGTTGHPKGVMLTYQNIWSNVSDILDYFQLWSDDRLFIIRPLTNASAITGELLPALYVGCSLSIKEPAQAPLSALKSMERFSTTVMCAAPTVVGRMVPFVQRYDLSSLRLLVLSGEILSKPQFQKIAKAFSYTQIWNAYGLTEASPRVSRWIGQPGQYKPGCVGLPLKSVVIRIVDADDHPVPKGNSGELIVRGPNVMKGYFKDSESTDLKVRDGWLYTSDRASIRNGFLYIHGRQDDLLIRSGMNVFPSEIEEKLLLHPRVVQAFVFDKTDDDSEIKIHAWVIGEPDVKPKDLHEFLIESKVDPRLWPDVIEMKENLPDTTSGKMKRTHE
jgi:long-chain acyl-CoA synthetase